MTNILGISAYYHDSAACLVQDGRLVAAAQEERFTRTKHDPSFPQKALAYCLKQGGICGRDLDFVVFYDKPLLKFDRLLETYISYAPRGFGLFLKGLPLWLRLKLHIARDIDRALERQYARRYLFTEHHEAHAASAFFPSPFEQAAIITLDGVGEWTTGSIGLGHGNGIQILKELRFPHSLGLLYSAFTYFTGFKVNSGEYKLMGLAPYGEPRYRDLILDRLIDLKQDGSFRMDMSHFAYGYRDVMTSDKLERLLGGPPRRPEGEITQREMDLAASIQAVTEEVVLRIARHAQKLTGAKNLTMAGGVALNCVANGRLLRQGPFGDIWVQPAAGDAGGALGAALFVWHQLLERPRDIRRPDSQGGSFLGPSYSNDEVRAFLEATGAAYRFLEAEDALAEAVAELLASGSVVGHMAGRMEFGPRALGNRSILGDPRSADMRDKMNLKIKFRESFRPFAPAVLREEAHRYFELAPDRDSPYMLLVAQVQRDRLTPRPLTPAHGFDKLRQARSVVPAVTHVDDSARIQTVDSERHPRLHKVIGLFRDKTGCPMVINTSFNVRGEPMVNTPEEAYRCFMATDMDALVIENFLLLKEDQPEPPRVGRGAYLSEFGLD